MAISILNNIPALAAENQLSITQSNLQQTLEQLSSGSRINSGADDAAGLAIADGLQANVTALTQSALNANEGVGKLQVADGALSQVTSLLNRAVTLATESANGTVSDGSQREALDAEFQSIKAEIDNIGSNTTYNGSQIFAGGSTNYNQIAAANSPAGLATVVTGTLVLKSTGGVDPIYTTNAGDTTVGAVINDINGSGTGLVAALDSGGHLFITDTQNRGTGSANQLEADANTGSFEIGSDSSAEAFTNTTNASTMNVFLSDSTVAGSSSIGVTLGTFSAGNMNGISVANDDLQSAGSAQTALTDINNAISQVAALRGSIGAGVNRLEAASNVISNQTQNLSSAEDGIQAADITQTVANLTKYQILSQTGISALAQANQMQQTVLKLLQ